MKRLEDRNEWASATQLSKRFGISAGTIRSWVSKIRRDTRLSLDERLSLVVGSNRTTRINVWGLFLWVETRECPKGRVIH